MKTYIISKNNYKILLIIKLKNCKIINDEESNFLPIKRKYNLTINRECINSLHFLKLNNINFSKTNSIIDLRNQFSNVYDQGSLGSCTANALCSLISFYNPKLLGSRLFLYYNERFIENNIFDDDCSTLFSGVRTLLIYGICQESEWIYDISNFAIKPSVKCYVDAINHKEINAKNILNDITSMKTALMNGNPFVVGILVYESFESYNVSITGNVPMPTDSEQCLGGHAVVCVGYNDIKKVWIMRNSWGEDWGDNGYFYLPYLYLLDSSLCSDLWCITKIN